MSKRHGATSLDAYRQKGYIPAGLNNFLALLGWAPSGEKEIFTMEEAIQEFSLDHVAKNPAVFDFKKLDWINGQHIRKMSAEAFWELAVPFMKEAGYMTGDEEGEKLEWLKKVVATAQTQIDYGAQIPEKVSMYFSDDFDFENEEAAAADRESARSGTGGNDSAVRFRAYGKENLKEPGKSRGFFITAFSVMNKLTRV